MAGTSRQGTVPCMCGCGKSLTRHEANKHLQIREQEALLQQYLAQHHAQAAAAPADVDAGADTVDAEVLFDNRNDLEGDADEGGESEPQQVPGTPSPVPSDFDEQELEREPLFNRGSDSDEDPAAHVPQQPGPAKVPLYPYARISVHQFALILMDMRQQHEVTDVFMSDLLQLLHAVVLPEHNTLPTTLDGLRQEAFVGVEHKRVTREFDICKNRCKLYHDDDNATSCSECHAPRRDENFQSIATVTYAPIKDKIIALLAHPETAQELEFGRNHVYSQALPAVRQSVLDGEWARHLYAQGLLHKNAIAVSLGFDGMQMFSKSGRSMWIFYLFIESVDPRSRHKRVFVHVLAVIDGEPKNMGSFMMPVIQELQKLAREGIPCYNAARGVEEELNVVLLHVYGDNPAMCKLLHFMGAGAICACRKCLIRGVLARHRPASRPLSRQGDDDDEELVVEDELVRAPEDPYGKKQKTNYYATTQETLALPMRTHAETRTIVDRLKAEVSRLNQTQFNDLCSANGISGETVLFLLDYFDIVRGSPIDPMHAIWLGLAKTLLAFITKRLTPAQREDVNRFIDSVSVPHDMTRVPQNPAGKSGTFIADSMRNFIMNYSVGALSGVLTEPYLGHWKTLVYILSIIMPYESHDADIDAVLPVAKDWLLQTTQLYPHSVNTLNMHYFLHLILQAKENGPLPLTSLFLLEGMNGCMKPMVTSTKLPVVSVNNRLEDYERLEYIRATEPDRLDPEKIPNVHAAMHPRLAKEVAESVTDAVGNALCSIKREGMQHVKVERATLAIVEYFNKYHQLHLDPAWITQVLNSTSTRSFWHIDVHALPSRSHRASVSGRRVGSRNRDSSFVIISLRPGSVYVCQLHGIFAMDLPVHGLHHIMVVQVLRWVVDPAARSREDPMATVQSTDRPLLAIPTSAVKRKCFLVPNRQDQVVYYVADYQNYAGHD